MPEPPPLAIAHRFGNELHALRAAEQAGADLIELDVWLYRGRLEVRHSKTLGPAPVLWDRWSLTHGWAPRLHLAHVLEAAAPETHLMLDLKGTESRLPGAVLRALHRVAPERPVTVCSQSWQLLDAFRDVPGVRVAHSVGNPRQLAKVFARLTWHDQHAISIHRRLLSPPLVRALRTVAPLVMSWPVNTAATLAELRAWGINGMISDNLALLRHLKAGTGEGVAQS